MDISIKSYDELPEGLKEEASNNGAGKDYALYIYVEHNGELIACESDAMEPEDATFGRDLNWIVGLLRKVYKVGVDSKSI